MASANLDLVRSIYADWEQGDLSRTDWADPEIECVIADGPAPGHWRGQNAMWQAWRDFLSVWEDWRCDADEYRELDGERVLVLENRRARAKGSGLRVGQTARETPSKAATSFTSAMAKSRGSSPTSTATAPSPISAWRSRRCRRRKW